jgi:hypothetical protein
MNFAYAIIPVVIMMIFLSLRELFNTSFLNLYFVSVAVGSVFSVGFYLKLKSENRKMKIIGDIEFTKKSIIKHIGDSITESSYESIRSIELQRHIPAINMAESKSGYYTYILSISFKNSHKECIVISDRPSGKLRDLSVTETIKTLKKIIPVEIILKL